MGSYWEEKSKYEKEKKDREQADKLFNIVLAIIGAVLTFIFVKILAPIASKHPVATFIVVVSLGIGAYVYFSYFAPDTSADIEKIESFDAFASRFSQDEDFCKQRINKTVVAEGYDKVSYKATELSAKKIMTSIIGGDFQYYTGDGIKNELCHGQFIKISNDKYVYQLKKSDNSLVKLYEFTFKKHGWYLTKIQKGGKIVEISSEEDAVTKTSVSSNNSKTNFIKVDNFNIFIPNGFIPCNKMENTYVIGDDSIYYSYEILSNPKGPWDLNPNACEADYSGSTDELYVSRDGGSYEMSAIWREYKKGNKWCLLSVFYYEGENIRELYNILAKSN